MTLYLDMSVIQSVPTANLNRDDLGSPKSVQYGGASRIRVSSQSWKREIRKGVEQELGEYAARTKLVPVKVAGVLQEQGWSPELAEFAGQQVMAAAGKKGIGLEKDGKSTVMLFVPEAAVAQLAEVCTQHREELEAAAGKKKAGQVLPADTVTGILKSSTVSISLMGRMLAELPGAKVDGAAQVAHAFTTHAAEPQRDFFTAVDDWLGAEDTGSAHMDTAEFSAGVFYRYATVNIADLLTNLEGDRDAARTAIEAFARNFLMSLPQAKKNSTAPHTVPDFAYFAVREHRPLSLAAAFEAPITADGSGYSEPSREALAHYATRLNRLVGDRHRRFHGHASIAPTKASDVDGIGKDQESFEGLIEAAVAKAMEESR